MCFGVQIGSRMLIFTRKIQVAIQAKYCKMCARIMCTRSAKNMEQ